MAKATKCSTATCSKTVDFKFHAPKAKKVGLGGSFNNWSADKNPLKKGASGTWTTSLKLPAGRHEYRYWVDGEWLNSQEPAECVPNSFGSWNCIVDVR